MMPLGFLRGDSMYSELKNIRQSAMAPISYMDKLVKIFSIGDWSKEYVQGTWKGWNKGVVNTIKAMPYVNPIKRAMDPEQAASFYRAY
ncbi:MAG: hypothetical protein LBE56_12535 [Tannerella sp.]|jgi:hypothetical protein|nr:hypothetical protein [Tannerella sp.]